MQLSGSSKADAVVSDRAPSVNAAPDIAPQVDNAVEGINDAKKKDPSGGNALLAGDGSDLALLALGDQTVIKRVTGAVEIAAEAGRGAAVAEATARVAALTEKIAGTNSNTFVKINEQNGATAVLEGGHYVVTGVEAAQFQPLLDAATRAHGTDRAPETLYFQEMTTELQVALERNKMSLAQRAAVAVLRGIGWNRSADKVRGDVFANYYTMPISDKASVVFYKKDDFDISHFQNTLKEIHQGAPVTTERSRIVEQGTSRLHEIVHNVAPLATVQVGKTEIAYNSEVRTETDSLGLLLTMGEEATKTGVNHSAGVPATGLSASYASQLVTAAQGAFRGSARRAGRAFSENADAAGNLSLTGALNALHIGLQTNEALAAEKQAMRDRLKAAYPEDSEYQEEQAVEVAYGRGVLSLFQSSKIRQEKAMAVMAAMSEKGKWFRPKA